MRKINPLDRKVRVGFIGAGNWAEYNHIPILKKREEVELVAIATHTQSSLDRVIERFPFSYGTLNYPDIFEHDLDAVVISTPHGLHYEQAKAALNAGCHVLVEKPMTLKAQESWELVRMADEKGLHLVVPYGWHYKRLTILAKEQLANGAVGTIEYISCHSASALRQLYTGKKWQFEMEDIPDPKYRTYGDPETAGGGQGYAQLSHLIGLVLWLTGLRGNEVFAYMSAPGSEVDLYDAITIKYQNGPIGVISSAGTLPTDFPKHQAEIHIFGSDGVLNLDLNRERLDVLRNAGDHRIFDVTEGEGSYDCQGPPNRFIDLIIDKSSENDSSGELGARAIEILDAAYRSADSGKSEKVHEA